MRICVISPSYPTSKTIVFVFVDQLCRAFADLGLDVTVIAPQSISRFLVHGEPLTKYHTILITEKGNSVNLYRPYYFSLGNGRFYKYSGKFFQKAILSAFEKIKIIPDLLYGHFWSSISAAYPISLKYDIPLMGASGEEKVALYDSFSQDQKRLLSERIRGLINVSTKNRDECIALDLICKSKTIVIPNATNLSLFKKLNYDECRNNLNINKEDFVVTFMGQFVARKGTMRLNEALKKLDDKNIKAFFIGKGVEDPDYTGILYKGRLEHNIIPQYLCASDVFVLPTENEGCSNAIVEALACGLPVISTDSSFNYDILNESNSILVDCYDIDMIADAIKRLKKDTALRNKLAKGAREMANNLSLEKRAEKIVSFIRERI